MSVMRAIGLMSGTSLDGIDAALIETDGQNRLTRLGGQSHAYAPDFRARLRKAIAGKLEPQSLEAELTDLHAAAVEALLDKLGRKPKDIDLVGFHGQTVLHRPEQRRTWQIGDGRRLAERLGADVVYDFRSADVAAGGEGAPLAPIYHAALTRRAKERPLAVVNIGGVANVTWIGEHNGKPRLIACDTGPGNGPIDDWVGRTLGLPFDKDGAVAAAGAPAMDRIEAALGHDFFRKPPPKSLDRLDFDDRLADGLTAADGAATLLEFTVRSILAVADVLPTAPARWLVTGGGRRNAELMRRFRELAQVPVEPIESVGADGDLLEAEAFAYMAVRSAKGLAISFPGTTGAPTPLTGGRHAKKT